MESKEQENTESTDDTQEVRPITLSELDNGSIEARFQEGIGPVHEFMSESGVSGSAKIIITMEFKQKGKPGFCDMKSKVEVKITPQTSQNVLLVRDGTIMEDVTSQDAESPQLFDRTETENNETQTGGDNDF